MINAVTNKVVCKLEGPLENLSLGKQSTDQAAVCKRAICFVRDLHDWDQINNADFHPALKPGQFQLTVKQAVQCVQDLAQQKEV